MSFTPQLRFRVKTSVKGDRLSFSEAAVLVKYLDVDAHPQPDAGRVLEEHTMAAQEYEALLGELARRHEEEKASAPKGDKAAVSIPRPPPRKLPIKGVFRPDGTPLDARWWRIYDLGPSGVGSPGAEPTRLARVEFEGDHFTAHLLEEGACNAGNLALYDAFLEQGLIRIDVVLGPQVVAPLILQLST